MLDSMTFQINVIKNLTLRDGILVGARGEEVFLAQGSADGACGPYCMFMAGLVLGGGPGRKTITSLEYVDRRTKIGKFFKALENNSSDGLFRSGTSVKQLHELTCHLGLKTEIWQENSSQHIKEFITGKIQTGKPVLFSILGKNLYHWLLAIGFSDTERKILCLDPSGKNLSGSYWNSFVTTNACEGTYYQYFSDSEVFNVRYVDAMAICKM